MRGIGHIFLQLSHNYVLSPFPVLILRAEYDLHGKQNLSAAHHTGQMMHHQRLLKYWLKWVVPSIRQVPTSQCITEG